MAAVVNGAITNNTAVHGGGGMDMYSNSNPTLTNVTISGNTSDANGGGFQLSENSPCINSGNPDTFLDPDNSISDIGSNPFIQEDNCNISGDLNIDNNVDVLDVVLLVNTILQ